MENLEPANFFIDLDSLMDTRLAIMVMHFKDAMNNGGFKSGKYHFRYEGSFNGLVDKEEFKRLYDERGRETLLNSAITMMPEIVRDFCAKISQVDPSRPKNYYPVVMLNVYPYVLNDTEIKNIVSGLKTIIKVENLEVEVVNMNLASISLEFVSKNITAMSMYNYEEWLETHAKNEEFNTKGVPEVTLFGPMVYKGELPANMTPEKAFKIFSDMSKFLVNLELLPSRFYSTYMEPDEGFDEEMFRQK